MSDVLLYRSGSVTPAAEQSQANLIPRPKDHPAAQRQADLFLAGALEPWPWYYELRDGTYTVRHSGLCFTVAKLYPKRTD